MSHFKNVAAVQDEFIFVFISLMCNLVPIYWCILLLFCGELHTPFYHYCVGNDAKGILLGEENTWPLKYVTAFTLVVHTAVYVMTGRQEKMTQTSDKSKCSTYAKVSHQEAEVLNDSLRFYGISTNFSLLFRGPS